MGSSKIIMLSGVYLIFGFYIVAYNNADELMYKSSMKTATLVQSEQLANTGLSLARTYMADYSSRYTFEPRTFVSGNDTVSYSAERPVGFPLSQTQVTSVASHTTVVDNEVKVTRMVSQTSVFQFHNGRWKMLRTFTEREYQDSF
ncbi:MAG: hypothetical protein WDA22_16445 [Bacteroidota bacterium]